jgi:Tfp pilus assembly protein PilV
MQKSRKDGVSLVEVVVALLVFSMCVAGICRLITMGRQGSDDARAHYTAINIAKNRLERVKTFEFDQIGLFAQSNVKVDRSGIAAANGEYRMTTTVSSITNDLKEVIVRVDIMDKISRQFDSENEALRTYIADYVMYGAE